MASQPQNPDFRINPGTFTHVNYTFQPDTFYSKMQNVECS